MKTALLLLGAGLIVAGCDNQPVKSVASELNSLHAESRGSVVLERHKPDAHTAEVAMTVAAKLRLWRRADGSCYVSIDVTGWETFFVEASGPICEAAPVKDQVLLQPADRTR